MTKLWSLKRLFGRLGISKEFGAARARPKPTDAAARMENCDGNKASPV